jgi:hypothetical protein
MGIRAAACVLVTAALLLSGAASAAEPARPAASARPAAATPAPILTPLLGEVLSTPRAVPMSDGRDHLVYEIRVSNVLDGRVELKRLAVLDAASGKRLLDLGRDEISQRLSLGGRRGTETATLGAFQFGIVFLHVRLDGGASVPGSLAHEIDGFAEPLGVDVSARFAETPVIATPPPVLGSPLRGGGYVVGDGCCDSIRHVRALLPLNGAFRLAQRFAIDWERIDGENRIFVGDPKDVRSYRIYGEPVMAVADGTVVGSRNDLPDQAPGALPANLPVEEADGNFVVTEIGGGAFVLYAHLRPGSVTPRPGDRVKRGDRIGEVGNTGNSQAPHLHLHVMDGPDGLLANGLPYVFESYAIPASDEAGTADFDRAEATGSPLTLTRRVPPKAVRNALPLDLSIVDWE